MASKDLPPLTANYWALFFKSQLRTHPQWLPKDTNLSEKVAIVTGSNTGMGLESTRQFLSFNISRVIMAVRSVQKGESAAASLRKQYPKAAIDVWQLNMNSYDSVQEFAERAKRELSRLDIVVLNAALGRHKFGTEPSTGHEETIQVNYLSTTLLAILLLPLLKNKSPVGQPGRLSIVNSALALNVKFPTEKQPPYLPIFDDPANFGVQGNYALSKLLGQMFLYKLVDHVSANDVIVNLVDPGFVKGTELQRDLPFPVTLLLALFRAATARTIQVGACTYLDATIAKGKESHGSYVADWEIRP